MNIGCCIATKDIPLAKEFGYDYVELSAKEIMKMDTELWKLKRKEILHPGIPVLGLSAFADEQTPLIGPSAQEEVWSAYLDILLERASQLHIKNIGIGAPKARMIPSEYDYGLATREMEYFLYTAARKASSYDITILYEALHPKECNFRNHTQECYQTVQHIHSPNLKLVYDVYHSINAGEQYADSRMCFDEIRHVHINSWDQGLQRYFLFEKDLPYVKDLCVFLQSVGYDNTISVEAFDADFPETGAASVSIIREALYEAEIKHPLSRTPSL